jgi:uncharacterized protein YdeI (YjbR/CyaY-like superfamily)
MAVSKELKLAAGVVAGELVAVTMAVDASERVVEVPAELKAALARNKAATKAFEALSWSHRKEFADWVGTAKKPETRLERAAKAIPFVLARKHVR